MGLGGWNIAKIEVKGQRSSKIWQPLKKEIKFCHCYSPEVDIWQDDKGIWGHASFLCKMTLVKVKVTIVGHKGQILGQISDMTYFQHMAFWEIMVPVTGLPTFCRLLLVQISKGYGTFTLRNGTFCREKIKRKIGM